MLMCDHAAHIRYTCVHLCVCVHLYTHVSTLAFMYAWMSSHNHFLQRLTLLSSLPSFCPLRRLLIEHMSQCHGVMCDGLVDGTGTGRFEERAFWEGIGLAGMGAEQEEGR